MLVTMFWLLVATVMIQIPNLVGMRKGETEELTLLSAVKVTFVTLPFTVAATIAFTMFYGRGIQCLSYPAMAVNAKVFAVLAALIIQCYLLR